MLTLGCGKYAGLLAITVIFHLHAVVAQPDEYFYPGFLSIDCGGQTNHTAENNITWVTDVNYIDRDVGETAYIGDASQQAGGSFIQYLRYFPKPLNKSCYRLPVAPNVPYLLRLWFAVGNYTGFQKSSTLAFSFSIETLGMLAVQNIPILNLTNIDPFYYEEVFVSSGRVLYICLIRTSETNDPFISAIELRALRYGMYQQAKPGTMLSLAGRFDFGGNKSLVRYPQDEFDRLWSPIPGDPGVNTVKSESSKHPISAFHTQNIPPSIVMQTAYAMTSVSFYLLGPSGLGFDRPQALLLLYFADIEPADMTVSFSVSINGLLSGPNITLARNYSALETQFLVNTTESIHVLLSAVNHSTAAILNAFEHYAIILTQPPTYSKDIEALQALKTRFNVTDWISDPCYLIEWKGISCDNSTSVVRISEMNLSGRNLHGPVPENIGKLTALVNLSLENNFLTGPLPNFSNLTMLERLYLQNNNLHGDVPGWLSGLENLKDLYLQNNNLTGNVPGWLSGLENLKDLSLENNHFTGPLPNFSNLTMLERLHLQNNALTGTVPDWLSGLENLTELFIENNNFSGEIPPQLLSNPSLVFRYSGNRYLYIRSNPNNHRVKLTLRMTLSGSALIVLVFVVAIVLHCKKTRRKEGSALYEDNSTIVVPNTTKSRVFTLQEIIAATQNFREKIGQGGFGSVFFGQLERGQRIAVKVLSSFSKQGVQEFLNEVNLLSTVHHKNLVTLLGYCIESRDLMLVYEHMPGGSLRDRLYDPTFELNWETRIKIALNAAQGLEYLHMGCTPKIIHRDIKTANILLDNNMNGKIADFGLSTLTPGGDASHVTCTIVKGTLGYLDPAYLRTLMLTDKSDVYSFGVVLLELLTGRSPINANVPEDELDIVQWVTRYVEMEDIAIIIDRRLNGNYDMESVAKVAKLALRCVQSRPSYRPCASEVVADIKSAIIHEYDLPISETIASLETDPICSQVDNMKWSDNSSNLTQVGR